jgi:hypothetical protein
VYPLIALSGCTAPLLPGEVVLGVEQAATFVYGDPGAHLGASVAARADRWIASAPGEGTTWIDGAPTDVPSAWVGWWGEREIRVDAEGRVFVDGDAAWTVAGAHAWAAGDAGVLAATATGLVWVDAARAVPMEGLAAVAWGTDRILGVVCGSAGCEAHAWDDTGADLGVFAAAGEGGAVGEWDGVAWAGDPAWDDPTGAGTVCAEGGTCVSGAPGDHLGAAIGGGYTAGTFNKDVDPPRARIVALDGGTTFVLEAGAELQPIELSGDDTLVIGAPYHPAHGEPSGAVIVVR